LSNILYLIVNSVSLVTLCLPVYNNYVICRYKDDVYNMYIGLYTLYYILDYIVYYSFSQLTQLHTLNVALNNLKTLPDR